MSGQLPTNLRTIALIEAVHEDRTDDIVELLRSHVDVKTIADFELVMRDILYLTLDVAGLASAAISVLALETGTERTVLLNNLRNQAINREANDD